jgi:hypothetical protein
MKTFLNHKSPMQMLICTLLILLLGSCQNEIELDIATSAKRLLVDAVFTTDTIVHTVRLSRTGSLLNDDAIIPVSGALVLITDGLDTIDFTESATAGTYQTAAPCFGIGGKTYTLSVTQIDIDDDGKNDSFTAAARMPQPVMMDSLKSSRGLHISDKTKGINNYAYFRVPFLGPDYIYKYIDVNKASVGALKGRLGSGEIARFQAEYKVTKPITPDTYTKMSSYCQVPEKDMPVSNGDAITFVCLNLTSEYFSFLKEFDNNTSSDLFTDNFYDQIKMPANVRTNISPAGKAAGYFAVYSVSRISAVLHE